MIKIIHQIWVGRFSLPNRFMRRSQKIEELNPDYKIIRWDETRLIEEFPEIKPFLELECVPTFISDWARIQIWGKYGGWYIDYDYEGFAPFEQLLQKSKAPDNPEIIVTEFERPGFDYISGFAYFDKGKMPESFYKYTPDVVFMAGFNNGVKDRNKTVIPREFVSQQGSIYKEERMRSFYSHKNFDYRLHKDTNNNWYLKFKD